MSIPSSLLALLAERPMHAWGLKSAFETGTGQTWSLNIGQVSTTLDRLVRDGLVGVVPPPEGSGGTTMYQLTELGRAQAQSWWYEPIQRGAPSRDELVIKLALAAASPDVDVELLVRRQRTETMRSLRTYTRLKDEAAGDIAWSLILDRLIYDAEAEVRWLDHVESQVTSTESQVTSARPQQPDADRHPQDQEAERGPVG